ncbi:MAG: T9SS type A sorting domain-containing protein [Melioribacteraceae bacterium]|nr:T9SS type A sorting domain-containing protein [Melioribacteraceae bacterium]
MKYLMKYSALFFFIIIFSQKTNAQVGEVIWEDNFNNLDNWNIEIGNGSWGWGNGELEYYRKENVKISEIPGESGNFALQITAKNESGPGITDQWGNPLNYTSGKLTTLSKISIKYGVVEARVRVPDLELGGWPAFWLLGTSNYAWPHKGEIDMMEMGHSKSFRDLHDTHNGGNGANNSTVNQMTSANALFFSDDAVTPENPSGAASLSWDPDDEYVRPYYNYTNPFNDRFLIYRMYWDDKSIRFTVTDEGTEYDLYTDPFPIDSVSSEFNQPFYLITNLAIGGALTDAYNLGDPGSGQPVSMPFPAEMYVDYVKVMKWNGMGNVNVGPPIPESGAFGIFTDSTITNGKLEAGISSEIYVWEATLDATAIPPLEGDNVLSWKSNGKGWFGAGIMSVQPRNLINFEEGNLNFSIKIPGNVAFKIGIIDTWNNQSYIEFPANQSKYGLVRNGEWGQASIPISEIRGSAIDLRMMSYEFVILEENGASVEFALDDIYWDGGGIPNVPVANAGPDQTVLDGDLNGSESVILDGSESIDYDGTIDIYEWSIGDSLIATGMNPEVILNLGEFIITLKVIDNDGKSSSDEVKIIVLNNYPPKANAGENITVADADRTGSEDLQLDASASTDSDGSIVKYSWKENGSEIATGVKPNVNFGIGKHTIILTVEDDDGATDSDEIVVTVNNSLSVSAPAIVFANETISIDTLIEQVWYETPEMKINNVTVGSRTSDFQAQWKAMYDNSNLYVLVEVTDEVQINDSGAEWYKDDCVEVFIDGNNSKGTSYDGVNDFQFGFRWDDENINFGNNSLNRTTGIEFITYKTQIGYNLEAKIPWATIGVTPQTNSRIGFDVGVDDDDNGGDRECAIASIFTADNAWNNPSVFGSIQLVRPTGIEDNYGRENSFPTEFKLSKNYPNPFNPVTTISYSLPENVDVNLAVYDLNGRLVKTLIDKSQSAGNYNITWNALHESSGVYFFKISAGKFSAIQKCILLK